MKLHYSSLPIVVAAGVFAFSLDLKSDPQNLAADSLSTPTTEQPTVLALDLEGEETGSDYARQVVDSIKNFNAQHNWDTGSHPVYGDFESREQLNEHMAQMGRAAIDEASFLSTATGWGPDDEVEPLPGNINPYEKAITADLQQVIDAEVEMYDRLIEDAARSAYSFLVASTEQHAANITPLPLDADPMGPGKDESLFTAYTHVTAGENLYVVHFRSVEFPDLEQALQAIQDLRGERLQSVRALVAAY